MKYRRQIRTIGTLLSIDKVLIEIYATFIDFLINNYISKGQAVDYYNFFSKEKLKNVNEKSILINDGRYAEIVRVIEDIEKDLVKEDGNYNGISFYIELHLSNLMNLISETIHSNPIHDSDYKSIPLDSLHYIGNNDNKLVRDRSFNYHLLHL